MNRQDAKSAKDRQDKLTTESTEWTKSDLQRRIIPAEVFARLSDREISVVLFPGVGLADQTPKDLPIECIPIELRTPNTKVWIQFNQSHEVIEVRPRT